MINHHRNSAKIKFKIFVLNTSLFTFYITLCISIVYNNIHGYGRSTDLLSQTYRMYS